MTYLSEDVFKKYLRLIEQSPTLAVDTEGTTNHPYSKTWGLSVGYEGISEYFAFNHKIGDNLPTAWVPPLKEAIEKHPCLVFHNAKHDLRALRSMGINYTGKFYDTMLMAHMNDENIPSKKLDYLSKKFGGEPKRSDELMKQFINAFGWDHIPVNVIRPYGANDAYITDELFHKLLPDFQEQGFDGELWDTEQKFCRLLGKIEDNGVLVDQSFCEQEKARGEIIMNEIKADLGFNIGSTKELGHFLIDELGLPVVKRNKPTSRHPEGQASYDKFAMEIYDELLQRRNDKRARQILIYRGWQKTVSSNYIPYLRYLDPEDGHLRPNFKQHGTVTCRLSCEDPNLQQIPRESAKDWNGKLKKAFIAEEGYTSWEFDYAQLEFRLGAAYAKAESLVAIFNAGRDIFTEMGKELGMERQDVKTLVYTIQYGGGANRIHDVFGVSTAAAKVILTNFFRNYPGFAKVSTISEIKAKREGYVQYWSGRRRHFRFNDKHRKAFNSVTQGGAFEIVKRQMIKADEAGLNNDECKMNLQVHDSVRFSILKGKEKEYIPEIWKILEDTPNFGVKFATELSRWATDEKYKTLEHYLEVA